MITLSRDKRHLDRAKLMNVWETLDKYDKNVIKNSNGFFYSYFPLRYMVNNKPHLRF